MDFLRLLETLRTPFFDNFFLLITRLGEETVFLIVALILIWCVDKKYGFYILYCGLMGQALNQFMKISFRVERPWVANPDFNPVRAAIHEAKGFSFPSGHTQIATTTYGGLALVYRNKKIMSFVFALLVLLVAFSRMYLGVHYPSDVFVSLVVNFALITVLYYFVKSFTFEKLSRFLRWSALALILVLFVFSYVSAWGKTDNEFYADTIDFASKTLGATLAFCISWYMDDKYINYSTKAVWYFQIFKVILGAGVIMIIKEGAKPLFVSMGLPVFLSHITRYFLIVFFAGTLWPYLFEKIMKKYPSLSKK